MLMTSIALIAMAASGWGFVDYVIRIHGEIACGKWKLENRIPDGLLLTACACCFVSAGHSLACIWIP